jgi:hypothetical protein
LKTQFSEIYKRTKIAFDYNRKYPAVSDDSREPLWPTPGATTAGPVTALDPAVTADDTGVALGETEAGEGCDRSLARPSRSAIETQSGKLRREVEALLRLICIPLTRTEIDPQPSTTGARFHLRLESGGAAGVPAPIQLHVDVTDDLRISIRAGLASTVDDNLAIIVENVQGDAEAIVSEAVRRILEDAKQGGLP